MVFKKYVWKFFYCEMNLLMNTVSVLFIKTLMSALLKHFWEKLVACLKIFQMKFPVVLNSFLTVYKMTQYIISLQD